MKCLDNQLSPLTSHESRFLQIYVNIVCAEYTMDASLTLTLGLCDFDFKDVTHTCALALFLIQLRQQYRSMVAHLSLSHSGPGLGIQIRDLRWRLDRRYPGPEKSDNNGDDDANSISTWCERIVTGHER